MRRHGSTPDIRVKHMHQQYGHLWTVNYEVYNAFSILIRLQLEYIRMFMYFIFLFTSSGDFYYSPISGNWRWAILKKHIVNTFNMVRNIQRCLCCAQRKKQVSKSMLGKQICITILAPLCGIYQKQQIGGKYLRRIKINNLIFSL